jgi:hypothetical protein
LASFIVFPSEEDNEHADDGDNNPYDPEEKASRDLGNVLKCDKRNGEIDDKEKYKPADP